MAVQLPDRVALAAAILMVREHGNLYRGARVFIPREAVTDEQTILWVEDGELDGDTGWFVTVRDLSELSALDQTPLQPLDEGVPGGEG